MRLRAGAERHPQQARSTPRLRSSQPPPRPQAWTAHALPHLQPRAARALCVGRRAAQSTRHKDTHREGRREVEDCVSKSLPSTHQGAPQAHSSWHPHTSSGRQKAASGLPGAAGLEPPATPQGSSRCQLLLGTPPVEASAIRKTGPLWSPRPTPHPQFCASAHHALRTAAIRCQACRSRLPAGPGGETAQKQTGAGHSLAVSLQTRPPGGTSALLG